MPFEIDRRAGERFTTYEVRGPATLDNFVDLIDTVHAETAGGGATRVLVDLRHAGARPAFSDQFKIGEVAALRLGHLERVASVVRADEITHTSEKVANRVGLKLRVFTELAAAQAWLAEDDAPAAA